MYVEWDGILWATLVNISLKNVNVLQISMGTHFENQILMSACYSHFDNSRYTKVSY